MRIVPLITIYTALLYTLDIPLHCTRETFGIKKYLTAY